MPTTRDADLALALETARLCVAAASESAMAHFRTGVRVETKADRTPVTQADRDAETAVLAILRDVYPRVDVLTEESGLVGAGSRDRWIVDPLDGTKGFSRGTPFWGPLVAFERDGQIVAGAMALPALGEAYWGARGAGCYLNGERLHVSGIDDWAEATVLLGEVRPLLGPPWGDAVTAMVRAATSVRCFGDLGGCAQLLAGRADVWLEAGVVIWDLAPLLLLVEEAGGTFTDLAGRRTISSGHALATNGRLHERALSWLLQDQA